MSKEEISEAEKINDIIVKCVSPSMKLDQSKPCGSIGSGSQTTNEQAQVRRQATMNDDYCPAPTFDIGLDEIFGASIDDEGMELHLTQQISRPSSSMAPNLKMDQSKQCGYISLCISQTAAHQQTQVPKAATFLDGPQQAGLQKQAAKHDVHCPPHAFDIVDEVVEVQLSQPISRASFCNVDMCPEARGKEPVIIEITEENDLWDNATIDLTCDEADRMSKARAGACSMGNFSLSNFQMPEKTCYKDGEVGSSSGSGEIAPNQFERRIIKPPACKRSPYVDCDDKMIFYCTPAVNRLYASVILHTRLSEEKSGDEDKRYSRNHPPPIPTFLICFFSFFIEQPIFLWEATHEHNIGNKKKNFQETRCEVNPLPLLLSIQGN